MLTVACSVAISIRMVLEDVSAVFIATNSPVSTFVIRHALPAEGFAVTFRYAGRLPPALT